MPNITKPCPSCQQSFTTAASKQQKFCSRKCMALIWTTQRQRVCQSCGVSFTVKSPSVPGIYCSNRCVADANSKAHRVVFNCKQCSKESSIIRYRDGRNGGGQFCSNACRLEWAKAGRWEADCEQCGSRFTVLGYRYKARFCSNKCRTTSKSAIRNYRLAHDWQCTECQSEYRAGHQSCKRCLSKRGRLKSKQRVIQHYGGKCACCGESRIEFMCIDHANNNGNVHRKAYFEATGLKLGGTRLYNWLWRSGYPEGFRVLCFNCNCARGIFGYCPHEKENDVSTISKSASCLGQDAD